MNANLQQVWNLLDNVKDPEIPVLSLVDLGVVQDVLWIDNQLEVVIIPTYSGCPAMKEMEADIVAHLEANNLGPVKVITRLSPAWTTDMISAKGLAALHDYGIAPPPHSADKAALLGKPHVVKCPQCGLMNTEMISQFGSTPCKALYRCTDCREPFDHFKCI